MSQLRVSYRGSPLSVAGTPQPRTGPRAGPRTGPRAGDRLPDETVCTGGRTVRVHELLARPGVHVLLDRDAGHLEAALAGPMVTVHRLSSHPGHGLIAVRPDGYVGFRSPAGDAGQLKAWLARAGAG